MYEAMIVAMAYGAIAEVEKERKLRTKEMIIA
jgi:hypothetical protein